MKQITNTNFSSRSKAHFAIFLVSSLILTGCGGGGTMGQATVNPMAVTPVSATPTTEQMTGGVADAQKTQVASDLRRLLLPSSFGPIESPEGPSATPEIEPDTTDLMRYYRLGDQFVTDSTMDIDPSVETTVDKVGAAIYGGKHVLAFTETNTIDPYAYQFDFTQNATTRDLTFLSATYHGKPISLPYKVLGQIAVGRSFYMSGDSGKIIFKMTFVAKETIKVPAGTFHTYKATGVLVKSTEPIIQPLAFTVWVAPLNALSVKQALKVSAYGMEVNLFSNLKSYKLN